MCTSVYKSTSGIYYLVHANIHALLEFIVGVNIISSFANKLSIHKFYINIHEFWLIHVNEVDLLIRDFKTLKVIKAQQIETSSDTDDVLK